VLTSECAPRIFECTVLLYQSVSLIYMQLSSLDQSVDGPHTARLVIQSLKTFLFGRCDQSTV